MFDSSCLVKIVSRHENGFKISNSQFLDLQISIISEHKFSFPQETNLALFGWFACRISRDCADSVKKDLKFLEKSLEDGYLHYKAFLIVKANRCDETLRESCRFAPNRSYKHAFTVSINPKRWHRHKLWICLILRMRFFLCSNCSETKKT